jgi:hypothetical protein
LTEEKRLKVVASMVEAHARLCDNPEYSFGIDLNEELNVFVAHFRTPKNTDTFVGPAFANVVAQITSAVLATDIPQSQGQCTFGDNGAEDLGREILKACQDEVYRKTHHDACPCHKEAA